MCIRIVNILQKQLLVAGILELPPFVVGACAAWHFILCLTQGIHDFKFQHPQRDLPEPHPTTPYRQPC